LREIHAFDPRCLSPYRDTPRKPMRTVTEESRSSILAPCPRHLFARSSAPGFLRQQAGASSRARAYPLDLPFDSPEATSTMHLTDDCHSLYSRYEHPSLGGSRSSDRSYPPSRNKGSRWFTPPDPLRRTVRQGDGHYPPSRYSDPIEPLTPLSPTSSLPPSLSAKKRSHDRPRSASPRSS